MVTNYTYTISGATINLNNEDGYDEGLLYFSFKISGKYFVCNAFDTTVRYVKVAALL